MGKFNNNSTKDLKGWQVRIFSKVWITYFAYYLCRYNMPWELYNMVEDRTEQNNLADKMPEKVEQLNKVWFAWAKRCNVLPMNPNRKK